MKKLVMIFAAAGFVLASCGGGQCLTCSGGAIDINVCESEVSEFQDANGNSISWQEFVDLQTTQAELSGSTCTVADE